MNRNRYRLKVHDRYQVEIKFEYPISKDRPRESFRVDTYFYIPNSLGIRPDSYAQNEFYQDLQTYTRYGTPTIPLEALLDEKNDRSPFSRVAAQKQALLTGQGHAEAAQRVEYELRILGCIFRGETRAQGRRISVCLAKPGLHPKDFQDAAAMCGRFLAESTQVVAHLRELQRTFLIPNLPKHVDRAFRYVDESMSVQLESVCGKVYRSFAQVAEDAPVEALEAARKLATAMQSEESYRREAGYPTAVDTSNGPAAARSNEYFLYRIGVLKKYVQSTLFLSVEKHQGSRSLLYTIYATAAMGAMSFFVILLWLLQDIAPINSIPYMFLAVVAYAFKDRIKESLKRYFSERMTGILRDRESELLDRAPSRSVVGRIAEAVSFLPLERVPIAVQEKRAPDELFDLAEDSAPETIIKYQKTIELYSDEVFKLHQRVDHLNEIVRFNVRKLLVRMDDPKKGLSISESSDPEGWYPPEESGNGNKHAALTPLLRVRATKVYHVNMILGISVMNERGTWITDQEKFRLVLSRDGIERVETSGLVDAESAEPTAFSGNYGVQKTPSGTFTSMNYEV